MADIATLEQDITRIKDDLSALKTDMAAIKAEMKHLAAKEDVERMGRTLIMWNVSSIIAIAGIIVAVVKFMG